MDYRKIPGHFYEYRETMQPERPYIHDYSKTMTMKLLLSIPDKEGGSKVFCTFEQALELIKRVDNLSRNIKKIIYLVGWQFNGHDDRYPAFNVVNSKLKREQDKNAADSLIWLMGEALKHNTTVSLHINMTDAYKSSPLWDTYVENNLIAKREDGRYMDIGTWGGNTAYQVWYKNEWESGYAAKRIDELLDMLPVRKAGTIHIDAYICRQFANSTMSEEREYRRKVFRYFRENNIDVTSEFLYDCPGRDCGELDTSVKASQRDDLVGLMPMAWWLNQKREDYISRPRTLLCGGKYNKDLDPDHEDGLGFLVGNSVHGEEVFGNFDGGHSIWPARFLKTFCLEGIPWYYQNSFKLQCIEGEGEDRTAIYSDGLIVSLKGRVIKHNNVTLREGNNLFMPVLWKENEIAAYSEEGYTKKEWVIPEQFAGFKKAEIHIITADGLVKTDNAAAISGNVMTLTVQANQALSIVFS